jgi:hypothetical protein
MNIVEKQRQKELKEALDYMNSAPPESYEQARTNYYTLKEGQGWLRTEKERLANNEVDPILAKITAEFESLNKSPEYQEPIHEIGDEAETRYLHDKYIEEQDKAKVADRLNYLGVSQTTESWIPYILDIVSVIIGLFCVYLLILKGSSLFSVANSFTNQSTNTI